MITETVKLGGILIKAWLHTCRMLLSCSTYDGDEEETMSSEVTHIVAEVEHAVHATVGVAKVPFRGSSLLIDVFLLLFILDKKAQYSRLCAQELRDLVRQSSQAVAVQKDWLESCFAEQRRVDTAHFLHMLR